MQRIVQDVQQLRNFLQQQTQIEQQCINLCNRIEQSAIQTSQVPLVNQQVVPFQQSGVGYPATVGSAQGFNPAVLNQVLATEQQYRAQQPPAYGGQWQ
jgi:hypothetical protein